MVRKEKGRKIGEKKVWKGEMWMDLWEKAQQVKNFVCCYRPSENLESKRSTERPDKQSDMTSGHWPLQYWTVGA